MRASSAPPPYPSQIPALTSLRFFVAYWVVLHHFGEYAAIGFGQYTGFLLKGYLGVDIFFMLSGFILSHVYWSEGLTGRLDYWNFLTKRLARIYPMHLATMALAGLVLAAAATMHLRIDAAAASLDDLGANLLLIHAWGATSGLSWNEPSWSISAEWFAYLLFPVMLAAALRCRSRPLVLVAIALAWLVVSVMASRWAGEGLFHRKENFSILRIAPEFCLGCALYALGRTVELGARATAALGAAFGAALLLGAHFGAPDIVLVLCGAALIYLLAELSRNGSLRWLTLPWLVYLGEISYSTYMIHGVIESGYFPLAAKLGGWALDATPVLLLVPALILVHLGSVAGYAWIERPGRFWVHAKLRRESLFRAVASTDASMHPAPAWTPETSPRTV